MRLFRLVAVMTVCIGGCAGLQPFTKPTPPSREELDELVRTIDDDPYTLHFEKTPSVHKLIEIGDPTIPRMLDLMLLDGQGDWGTRLHAQTVLYSIILKKNGFDPAESWHDSKGSDRARAQWMSLGDLDYEAPLEERERAVKLWRKWLESRRYVLDNI